MATEHNAYADALGGGYDGYQAKCWDCDWQSENVHPPGSEGKRLAQEDSIAHRFEPRENDGEPVPMEFNDTPPEPGGMWMPMETYKRLLKDARGEPDRPVAEVKANPDLLDSLEGGRAARPRPPASSEDERFWSKVRRALAGEPSGFQPR